MRFLWAIAALALLLLVPGALASEPSVTSAVIIYPGEEDQVFIDTHAGQSFELLVTVEDDLETRAVTAEFIHDDTGDSFLVHFAPVQNAKTVVAKTAEKETSEWRMKIKVDRPDLTTGLWDIVIRAFDNTQDHTVYPDLQAGEEMDPLNVAVQNAVENTKMEIPGRATATEGDPDVTYDPRVMMRAGDRLRANVSMGANLVHKVTYQLHFGNGLFSDETVVGSPYSIGKEILQEGNQQVVFRAYPRDLDRKVLTVTLPNVTFDTRAPTIGATQLPAAVFQGVTFPISVPVSDATDHTVTMRFFGLSRGTQVVNTDLDAGGTLTRLPGSLAYFDADNDRKFNPGDDMFWDADNSLTINDGDIWISNLGAGTVIDFDSGAPLVRGGEFKLLYSDLDGSGAYSAGDSLILDDPAGTGLGVGKRSAMDIVFSGRQLGTIVGSLAAEKELPAAPLNGLYAESGVWTGAESVYLSSNNVIDHLDVRVANPVLDLVLRTDASAGASVISHNVFLFALGTVEYEIEARDAVGNRAVVRRTLEVVEPTTQVKVVDVVVHNATPLPGHRVDFTATINQTDAVTEMPISITFAADDESYFDIITLPAGEAEQVNHTRFPRPGRHVMNVSLEAVSGATILNGSVLWKTVEFEVFLGAVEYDGQTFWIRANARGLPGSAVLNPGDSEEVFDLKPHQLGLITGQSFEVDGVMVIWDPTQRNADGEPITRFEPKEEEGPVEESPLPVALVVVGLLAAAWRRR